MNATIQVSQELKDAVAVVKADRSTYLFAKIDETDTVTLDLLGRGGLPELIKTLPEDGCRYVFFDFAFTTRRSGSPRHRLVMIAWSPAGVDPADKTRQAALSTDFSRMLASQHSRLRASSPAELEDGLVGIRDATP